MRTPLIAITALSLALLLVVRRRRSAAPPPPTPSRPLSKLVFLGSGDSAGTPILFCLLGLIPGRPKHGCHVCNEARTNERSKHKRRNPCLLVQSPSREFNALIDCGKTFRDAAQQFFPEHGVNGISAVLLTHEHADATFGLDELRTVQKINPAAAASSTAPPPPSRKSPDEFAELNRTQVADVVMRAVGAARSSSGTEEERTFELSKVQPHPLGSMYQGIVIWAMERTRDAVGRQFPYLFSKGVSSVPRFVSQLEFKTFDFAEEGWFAIDDFFSPGRALPVQALRLIHGAGYDCAGFLFGEKDKVAYLSDVSFVPSETRQRLDLAGGLALLVLDALRPVSHDKHERPQVHFDLEDALEFVLSLRVKPKLTLLTGLGHEFDYYTTNQELAKLDASKYGKVAMAYDGLELELDL